MKTDKLSLTVSRFWLTIGCWRWLPFRIRESCVMRGLAAVEDKDEDELPGLLWTFLCCLAFWAAAAALILICTSCTLTVSPDGSRTYGLNGEEAARAIIVLRDSEK